jgi:hypothetical protein
MFISLFLLFRTYTYTILFKPPAEKTTRNRHVCLEAKTVAMLCKIVCLMSYVVVLFPHLSTLQMNQSNDYFAREYEIINEKKNEEENGFFACPFYIQSISHDDKLKIITIDTCLPS